MTLDQPLIITGPIGSGKSFIAQCFAEGGWAVLNADEVGHQVLNEPEVIGEIRRRWPEAADGESVDRALLGTRVFTDSDALEALQQLTHPRIMRRIDEWLDRTHGRKAVEISVLQAAVSKGGTLLVVDASLTTRLERLESRGMTPTSISHRMSAQPHRAMWLAAGHVVLNNEKSGSESVGHLIQYLERRS